MNDAQLVRLSYGGTDEKTILGALSEESYVQYLRRSKAGPVTPGTEWDELVNDGCGTTHRVTLTVETVVGGDTIGEQTTLELER
jgi:hypothetical protein